MGDLDSIHVRPMRREPGSIDSAVVTG
jgi:hypothetical protein